MSDRRCPRCKEEDGYVLGVVDDQPFDEALYLVRCEACGHEFTVERTPLPPSTHTSEGSPESTESPAGEL